MEWTLCIIERDIHFCTNRILCVLHRENYIFIKNGDFEILTDKYVLIVYLSQEKWFIQLFLPVDVSYCLSMH